MDHKQPTMEVEAPLLDGPEDFHVYMAYSETEADRKIAFDISVELTKMKFRCLDPETFYSQQVSSLQKVENAVMRSKTVLIVLSQKFLQSALLHLVATTSQRKAGERSQSDFILLVLVDVEEEQIPVTLRSSQTLKLGCDNFINTAGKILSIVKKPEMAVLPVGSVAKGLAWSYFYGYLAMLLPGLKDRYRKFGVWREDDRVMPLKMFIVLPASCFCPPKLPAEFVLHDEKVQFTATRAGCQNRNYNSTVYKIKDEEDKAYYVQIEYATPVLSMWEMWNGGIAGMRDEEKSHQLNLFHDVLQSILRHPTNTTCHDKAVLIYYDDVEKKISLATMVLDRIKSEIQRDLEKEKRQRTLEVQVPTVPGGRVTHIESSVFQIEDDGGYLLPRYQMNLSSNRGRAVIISVRQFDASSGLPDRKFAEIEEAMLKTLWEELGFLVELVVNPTSRDIMQTMAHIGSFDHSQYQAFICCVLSHGQLGAVLGADAAPVKITDVTHLLTENTCPSLADKPKMFFIDAPQWATDSDSVPDLDVIGSPVLPPVDEAAQHALNMAGYRLGKFRTELIPGAKDFLMSYASLPGQKSYQKTNGVTIYIDALCHFINEHKGQRNMDLERILKRVSESVEKQVKTPPAAQQSPRTQFPFHLTTMNKLLYLVQNQF